MSSRYVSEICVQIHTTQYNYTVCIGKLEVCGPSGPWLLVWGPIGRLDLVANGHFLDHILFQGNSITQYIKPVTWSDEYVRGALRCWNNRRIEMRKKRINWRISLLRAWQECESLQRVKPTEGGARYLPGAAAAPAASAPAAAECYLPRIISAPCGPRCHCYQVPNCASCMLPGRLHRVPADNLRQVPGILP